VRPYVAEWVFGMYASRVTCITRHELDGQYQNSEDGIPAPFLGQQLDVGEDMLGFFARWKGVVAALALSSKKRLHRCSILTHLQFAKSRRISL